MTYAISQRPYFLISSSLGDRILNHWIEGRLQTFRPWQLPTYLSLSPHQCFSRKVYLPNKLSHKNPWISESLLGESKPKQIWTSCMRILPSVSVWVTTPRTGENRWLLFHETRKKNMFVPEKLWDGVKWHKAVWLGWWKGKLKGGYKNWDELGGRWPCQVKYKWSCRCSDSLSLPLRGPSVNLLLLSQEISGSGFYLQMVRGAECHLMVGVMKSPVEATGHLTYICVIHST